MRLALYALIFVAIGVVAVILAGYEEPSSTIEVTEVVFSVDHQGRQLLPVLLASYDPPRERTKFDVWSGISDRTDLPDPHISAFEINFANVQLPNGGAASLLYQVININFEFSEALQQRLLVTSVDGQTSRYSISTDQFLSFDRSTRDFLFYLGSTKVDWIFLGIEVQAEASYGKQIAVFSATRNTEVATLLELSRIADDEQIPFVERLFELGLVDETNLQPLCEKNRAVLNEYLQGFLGDETC